MFANQNRVVRIVLSAPETPRRSVQFNRSTRLVVPDASKLLQNRNYCVVLHDSPVTASIMDRPNELVATVIRTSDSVQSADPLDEKRRERVAQIVGHVGFRNVGARGTLVSYDLQHLRPMAFHAIHVHEWGDMRDGCASSGAHWNPDGGMHGGVVASPRFRHVGDLGNVRANENGRAIGSILVPDLPLYGRRGILGRMLVIHEGKDDLGRGCESDSLTTGHAGARIGCGVIGYGRPPASQRHVH